MAVSRNKNHVWENMSNEELLRSANLILTDLETKREVQAQRKAWGYKNSKANKKGFEVNLQDTNDFVENLVR